MCATLDACAGSRLTSDPCRPIYVITCAEVIHTVQTTATFANNLETVLTTKWCCCVANLMCKVEREGRRYLWVVSGPSQTDGHESASAGRTSKSYIAKWFSKVSKVQFKPVGILAGKRIMSGRNDWWGAGVQGTCVNNEFCVMFKRGAFDLGATVFPVAIRYNKIFVDAFWNSKKQSFTAHLVRMLYLAVEIPPQLTWCFCDLMVWTRFSVIECFFISRIRFC